MGRIENKLRRYRLLLLFGFWTCPLNALLLLTGVQKMGTNADGDPYPGWLGALILLLVVMPLCRWLLRLCDSELKGSSKDDS